MAKGRGHSALKGYSYKEFEKVLNQNSFYFHHANGAHAIFTNRDGYFVVVPDYKGKEVNHMMSTVILQRIKNGQCKKDKKYICIK